MPEKYFQQKRDWLNDQKYGKSRSMKFLIIKNDWKKSTSNRNKMFLDARIMKNNPEEKLIIHILDSIIKMILNESEYRKSTKVN